MKTAGYAKSARTQPVFPQALATYSQLRRSGPAERDRLRVTQSDLIIFKTWTLSDCSEHGFH